jgi:hypothetical protein
MIDRMTLVRRVKAETRCQNAVVHNRPVSSLSTINVVFLILGRTIQDCLETTNPTSHTCVPLLADCHDPNSATAKIQSVADGKLSGDCTRVGRVRKRAVFMGVPSGHGRCIPADLWRSLPVGFVPRQSWDHWCVHDHFEQRAVEDLTSS